MVEWAGGAEYSNSTIAVTCAKLINGLLKEKGLRALPNDDLMRLFAKSTL
ncbi:hypothetical protein PDY_17320 [Photobacterium damselae subsp. damselae]|nr:hypothetical protein PDY_17320 [Photobacterium damselae subsp. damselae]